MSKAASSLTLLELRDMIDDIVTLHHPRHEMYSGFGYVHSLSDVDDDVILVIEGDRLVRASIYLSQGGTIKKYSPLDT